MAHFAQLDNNNIVTKVVTVNNNELLDNGLENENKGINFLISLFGNNNWKQTSYNSNFRKNYAGIGYGYSSELDAFIPPKPYASWSLNVDNCQWQPPIEYPTDGKNYTWNENSKTWIRINMEENDNVAT
jgi:hypothetical protein